MAEIQGKGKGSPKVDLTPMVDLNLLLITFFMLATTLSKPNAMEINMPFKNNQESQSKVKEDAAMTILIGDDHQLYYYHGMGSPDNPPVVMESSFKADGGIRDVIIEKKKTVKQLVSQGVLLPTDELTILIKPDTTCTTDDVIDIIDEMTINGVSIYTLTDITTVDQGFISDYEQKSGAANK